MAEYVSAKIAIGGDLARRRVAELWAHVQAERAGPDWGVRFVDEAEFIQRLQDGAGGVTFYGDEVRSGEFERIQAFCVEHRLTYLLTYNGCAGEWGPARRRWRPGEDEVGVACSLDGDGGSACITDAEIRSHRFTEVAAIRAHLQAFDRELTPPLVLVGA